MGCPGQDNFYKDVKTNYFKKVHHYISQIENFLFGSVLADFDLPIVEFKDLYHKLHLYFWIVFSNYVRKICHTSKLRIY